MSRKRTFTLPFAALALILGASAASAQVLTEAPALWSPTYAKGAGASAGTSQAITVSIASGGPQAYTLGSSPALPGWLSASCTALSVTDSTTSDTCTLSIVTAFADHLAPGHYSFTVNFQIASVTDSSVPVSLTITGPSPLSTSTIAISYISHGVSNQTSAKATATIADSDTIADTYTISAGSVPSWLSFTCVAMHASVSAPDTCSVNVIQTPANALSAGLNTASVLLKIAGQSDLTVTVNLTVITAQPLTTTATAVNFAYTIGASSAPAAQTAPVAVASGSAVFTLDPATVPVWMTASSGGTAVSGGVNVTFTPVSTVVKSLAAGNYSGNVGYQAAGATSELLIPVVLTVSNPTATISLKGASNNPFVFSMPGSVAPTPVVTVISSDEPIGFTATCSVTSSNQTYVNTPTSCLLNGGSSPAASVTSIAYTFGTPLTTQFEAALFSSVNPFGTVITETVTVVAGSQSPVVQTFVYTIQPIAPTFTALTPTSAAQIPVGDSLVVTLTGTNFVGPGMIQTGSSLSPTKVFVGTTDVTSFSVVVNSTTLVVSVPQVDFPVYPPSKTTVNMVLGLANQTGTASPTAATVTQNLVITNAPVIYAVTSTATYKQPNPGSKPIVAPYELISIFGSNFGATGPVSGTISAYSQFNTTVNVSGAGTTQSPFVTLSVSFKVGATIFKAPLLFVNASQINAIVPAGLTVGQPATVTVTSGTTSSDGLFAVSVVPADPGIFTLSSQGVGQGAILNQDYSVNTPSNPAAASSVVSIYMTGLGAPNSVGVDNSANTGLYPGGCVAVSNVTSGSPGYLQTVNTTTKTPVYTAPTPAWTNIDGAVFIPTMLLGHALPPCFTAASATAVSVTIGSGLNAQTVNGASILYAGFVPGSVAGLYQVTFTVPSGLQSGVNFVTVTLGTEGTSPAGVVSMGIQ